MRPPTKPADLNEYTDWMWEEFDLDATAEAAQYERVTSAVKRQVLAGRYWRRIDERLPELASTYYVRTGFQLGVAHAPELKEKSWQAFWLKTFRRNVTENARWPRPPTGGWLTPANWYTQIGDTVRTRMVVRYLDGVDLLVDELASAAVGTPLKAKATYQATRDGYYAAHLALSGRFIVPRPTFDTERTRVRIEVQVTTQVKDVIQELLHKFYEERRLRLTAASVLSEWDYLSDAFRSTYLGHLAHHMEAEIMQLRRPDEP